MVSDGDIEYPIIVVSTVIVAGIVSGLNLALFSLDFGRVKAQALGQGTKAAAAKKVSRLMSNPHWVLVTLLVANAAAVETMPLALNQIISSEFVSIAISVILVLVFGEIIPQALFVSHALTVGAFFAYFVWALMIITAPVSLCVGFLLDKLVGHRDTQLYRRRELLELIKIQGHRKDIAKTIKNDGGESGLTKLLSEDPNDHAVDQQQHDGLPIIAADGLTQRELRMMMGALKLSDMRIRAAIRTRNQDIFSVSIDAVVDKDFVKAVYDSGFSRIPVYEGHRDNVTKYLIAKTLVLTIFDKQEGAKRVRDLTLVNAVEVSCDQLLSDAYTLFSSAVSTHMIFVRDEDTGKLCGLFTFDDLLDQINGTAVTVSPGDLAGSFAVLSNTFRRSLNGTWNSLMSPTAANVNRPVTPTSTAPFSPTMFIERTKSGYQVRSSMRMGDGGAVTSSGAIHSTVALGLHPNNYAGLTRAVHHYLTHRLHPRDRVRPSFSSNNNKATMQLPIRRSLRC